MREVVLRKTPDVDDVISIPVFPWDVPLDDKL